MQEGFWVKNNAVWKKKALPGYFAREGNGYLSDSLAGEHFKAPFWMIKYVSRSPFKGDLLKKLCLRNPRAPPEPGPKALPLESARTLSGPWTPICRSPSPRDRAQQSGRFSPAERETGQRLTITHSIFGQQRL